jgi:hypothetical protein
VQRYPDWQTRLDVFLRENGNRRFKYGEWDCCLFVASAIEAMTGVDPAQKYRGKYSTMREARDVAEDVWLPFDSRRSSWIAFLVEAVTEQNQMVEVSRYRARRGDVALIKRSSGHSLGIVSLNGSSVTVVAGDCLIGIPFSRIKSARAWRVG